MPGLFQPVSTIYWYEGEIKDYGSNTDPNFSSQKYHN